MLVAVPLIVVAPLNRRVHFALAVLAAAAVVTVPLLVASSGGAARDILLGSSDDPYNDGTMVALLHLQGVPVFIVTRLAPLALAFLLTVWIMRARPRRDAEPVVLVSVVALSLSMRLIFESSLYGYYFMALTVALVLLDVLRAAVSALHSSCG